VRTQFKGWGAIIVFVLMEALLITVHNVVLLGVLDSESVVWWLADTGGVNNGDGFVQLSLVAQLIMQVYRRQEHIILGVSVDPANGDNRFSYLHLEKLHFVRHGTLVITACLRGNNKSSYDQLPVLFNSA